MGKTMTRSRCARAHAPAVPACGRRSPKASWARSWVNPRRNSAMQPPSGRSPCCRSICNGPPANGSRPTRCAGNCSGSTTCGSGPATGWTRTPSWRKKRRIRRQIRQLRPRSVLLAEDETDLLLFPPLRAGWSLRGQPQEVRLSGRNARRVVFGAMNLGTGRRWFLVREEQKAVDYQALLRLLHEHYRGWHVALLPDEDPSHTAGGSVALASEFDMEIIPLPKRSPQLNP